MHVAQNYNSAGPGTRQPARWNTVSTCMPFLGLLFAMGLLFALASTDALGQMLGISHPAAVVAAALSFWLGFGVLGLVAAVFALVRAERLWGITLVGFLLNAPLALVFVLWDGGWAGSLHFVMQCVLLACAALLLVGFLWPRIKATMLSSSH
jgi:hypothetical protein